MGGAPYKSAKEGGALFRLFPHLTMKERPHHVYSDTKPSKKIIAHKIMYSGFEVKSWWHTTLRTAQRDSEHSVARGARCISYILLYAKMLCMFLTWDTHSARGRASQTPREARSGVGAHSSKLWPYAKNWAKRRCGRSFVIGPFFARLQY